MERTEKINSNVLENGSVINTNLLGQNNLNSSEPKEIGNTSQMCEENKLQIERIEVASEYHSTEISLKKFTITGNELKQQIPSQVIQNKNTKTKIIPTKIKSIGDFIFFSYCELQDSTNSNGNKSQIGDFGFILINSEYQLTLNSQDLKYKLPSLNYKLIETYKNFSNFYIQKFENSFLLLLVVYNFVCVVKLNIGKEKVFEVLFRKEFSEDSLLMLLGNDAHSDHSNRFYLLVKPNQKMLIINQKIKKKNGLIKITYEEKNSDLHFGDKKEKLLISNCGLTRTGLMIFSDKNKKQMFVMPKNNYSKFTHLENSSSNDLTNIKINQFDFKNFLVFTERLEKKIYLVTDEIINNKLVLKLWKINSNNLEISEPVNIEIQQIIHLKLNSEDQLGFYKFSYVNETTFCICLYDFDQIFIFKLGSFSETNNLLIKNIHDLTFQEFYALDIDMNLDSENNLNIVTFQDEEFLTYHLDLESQLSKKLNFELFTNNHIKKINPSVKIILPIEENNLISASPILKPKNLKPNENTLNNNKTCQVTRSILNEIEARVDKLIDFKMNTFTNTLNDKLGSVFTFMKKQGEQLEEIRSRNNEAMANLTNLIIKSHDQKAKTQKVQNNNNKFNRNAYQNIYPFHPNMYNHPNNVNQYLMNLRNNQAAQIMNLNQYRNISQIQNDNKKNVTQIQNFNNGNNKMQHMLNKHYEINSSLQMEKGNRTYEMNEFHNLQQGMDAQNLWPRKNETYNFLETNQMSNNLRNLRDLSTDNKFKEDDIHVESSNNKLNEERQIEKMNLSLNLKKEKDINAINYSSDVSSGNLDSDINFDFLNADKGKQTPPDSQNIPNDKTNSSKTKGEDSSNLKLAQLEESQINPINSFVPNKSKRKKNKEKKKKNQNVTK